MATDSRSSLTQNSTTVRSFSYDGNVTDDTHGSTIHNYVYHKRNRLAEFTIGSRATAGRCSSSPAISQASPG